MGETANVNRVFPSRRVNQAQRSSAKAGGTYRYENRTVRTFLTYIACGWILPCVLFRQGQVSRSCRQRGFDSWHRIWAKMGDIPSKETEGELMMEGPATSQSP